MKTSVAAMVRWEPTRPGWVSPTSDSVSCRRAHRLGACYDAAHDVAKAILLPHVMGFNAESMGTKFREIARAMGLDGIDAMTIEQARIEAIRAVATLAADLGAPGSLREIGASKDDIPTWPPRTGPMSAPGQPSRGDPGCDRAVHRR